MSELDNAIQERKDKIKALQLDADEAEKRSQAYIDKHLIFSRKKYAILQDIDYIKRDIKKLKTAKRIVDKEL